MPSPQPTAFLVAETNDAGAPRLNGRRRLAPDLDTATDTAAEIDGATFALERVEVSDIPPMPATRHVRLAGIAQIPVAVEPKVISSAYCPCGYRAELYEGATEDDRTEFAEDWEAHIGYCDAEVA
jgi:hypothetical protein